MEEILISIRERGSQPSASVSKGDAVFPVSNPLPEFDEKNAAALRWLLEDSPRLSPVTAKPAALGARTQLTGFGQALFESLREPLESALEGRRLNDVALCIDDPTGLTRNWPWELLIQDESPVVFDCRAFIRRSRQHASRRSSPARARPLKLLVVTARPRGLDDVPFRSVASRILEATSRESTQVELLRPPTFEALRARLLSAKAAGAPFDIVHFDGHGDLLDAPGGRQGVLLFEDPETTGASSVEGRPLGELLVEADVPLLILNACHAGSAPLATPSGAGQTAAASVASASLAEQVTSCGAIDVVALSHAVHVATAASIVEDVYRCLDRGHSVGAAVTFARRRWLEAFVEQSPSIGYCIIRHFGTPADSAVTPEWPDYYREGSRSDDRTPHHPRMQGAFHADAPFVAADDPILLIEQALRRSAIVQLNGLRGSGKTSLLLELGRWLAASTASDPERIVYLDLREAPASRSAVEDVERPDAAILLIDHADCIEGDPLRKIAPWPDGDTGAFIRCLEMKSKEGIQILVASSRSIAALAHVERVVAPRLTVGDVRKLVALRTDPDTAARIPEPAILWTAGHPGVVPILIERAAAGDFVDPARTLDALSELRLGRFSATQPPLREILPLVMPGVAALFEPDVAMPWLLMQFQGQCLLSPILWQMATASGLTSLGEGESHAALEGILADLERAGLVAPLGDVDWLVHPLLPCVVAHPYNEARLHTEGYLRSLGIVQGLYAHYIQWLAASPFSSDERSPGNAKGWDLQNLLHAFTCLAGELQVEHMGALSLARRLRARFAAMELPEYWTPVLHTLKDVFDRYPPPTDDGTFNPRTEMNLLLMEEAGRLGDDAAVAELAKKAAEAARHLPGPGGNRPQTNAYDVQLKTGRQLADTDKQAALEAFNAALVMAGDDDYRKAIVQLELTRLLRTLGTRTDLLAARGHGESALSILQSLVSAGIDEQRRIVLITMSLSLVYMDLLGTDDPDPGWTARGEELCRKSLQLSEEPAHEATAWFNLGRWRVMAGDHEEAADDYLEAASLYERLGNPVFEGYSLAYRANSLLERGEALQARFEAVRAVNLLVAQPDASKAVIRYAYQVAERALQQAGAAPE